MYINLNNEKIFVGTGHKAFLKTQPTIAFIHGAGMSHLVWALYTRYYAHNGFNVLAIDLPGHGLSEGELRSSVESMADFVNAVLDHFGVEDCRLVGHSMGSLVAIETAHRKPERVTQLVLIGCAYPMVVGEVLLEAARNNDPRAIDMMVIWGHDYAEQIGGNRVPGVRAITQAKRWLEAAAPNVLFNDLNACNEYKNAEIAVPDFKIPVTMIVGDRDKMTPPKVAAGAAKSLPHVSFRSIKKCGHGCMLEQPEKTHVELAGALTA
ncbi:MAG: alpha/beta fold hydrolase [Gammaproteobacteria bacterium]